MRVIFMGTTEFGFICLKKLLEMKENVVAVFTLPRVFKISDSEKPMEIATYKNFESLTKGLKIPLFKVLGKINEFQESIGQFKPDFILVAGWHFIIPESIISIPRLGCVGIHASLLPKYRGWAPLVWAIINGEKKTGVSLFYLEKGMDSGDIIAQEKIIITEKDNIKTVYQKAAKAALQILEKSIPLIETGKAPWIKQNEIQATYFPQRKPEDGLIDWNKSSLEIYNWIRAQTKPYPGAFFFGQEGQKIKVWSAKLPSKTKKIFQKPGMILEQDIKKIKIATGDGYLTITNWETEK